MPKHEAPAAMAANVTSNLENAVTSGAVVTTLPNVGAALQQLKDAVANYEDALQTIDAAIAESKLKVLDLQMAPPSQDEFVEYVLGSVREHAKKWELEALKWMETFPASCMRPIELVVGYDGAGRTVLGQSSVSPFNPLCGQPGEMALMAADTRRGIAPAAMFAVFSRLLLPELEKWLRSIDLGLPKQAAIPLAERDTTFKRLRAEHDDLIARRREIEAAMRAIYHLQSTPTASGNHVRDTPSLGYQFAAAQAAAPLTNHGE